ncbi:MAG: hypothetical protein ABIU29_12065 [Chthoniobacterales bacterium]
MYKFARVADRTAQTLALVLSLVYLCTGVTYLWLDYWPVTESDFWQIYHTCLNSSWIQSALLKFNNHSLFFPSFVWLSDLHFFHGDQGMLFGVGLLFLVASTFLLLLPIWRAPAIDLTGKCLATLTITVASFWMGRAAITTSGGFNCMTSLVMLSAVVGFILLRKMQTGSTHYWPTATLLVFAGFVATFSFGSGLAVWPSFLFLGWNLRLPRRSLAIIAFAALVALLIFRFLPPPEDGSALLESINSPRLLSATSLKQLCWFIGAPVFYSVTAWEGVRPSPALIESSGWLLWGGLAGLAFMVIIVASRLTRKNLPGPNLEFVGLALIIFNFFVALSVVASRVERFREIPVDVAAPRYLFWTSLFWAGLLLVALHYALPRRWLRWPCILIVLSFPVVGWPEHRDEGLHWRYARLLADEGATSLINGVTDPARLLAPTQEHVDALAPQLRARRLDMFAEGLQDWIGLPVSKFYEGNEDSAHFRGRAFIKPLTGGRDEHRAAKVTGQLFATKSGSRSRLVIVAPDGRVAGIARSFHSDPLLNRLLYGGRMPNGRIAGYIRDYHPASRYVLRAADEAGLSSEQIAIAPSESR